MVNRSPDATLPVPPGIPRQQVASQMPGTRHAIRPGWGAPPAHGTLTCKSMSVAGGFCPGLAMRRALPRRGGREQGQRRSARHSQGGVNSPRQMSAPTRLAVDSACRVVRRVLAVIQRPALANDPLVDALAADVAHRQQSGLAVAGVADALDLSAVQALPQPLRRGAAARPRLAVGGADLLELGGVDAAQPNPLAGDDDGVAVDDRGRAGDISERRGRRESSEQQWRHSGSSEGPMRRGQETRPADAAAAERTGDAGRTYPGLQAVRSASAAR